MRLSQWSVPATCLLALSVSAAETRSVGELSFRIRDETAPAGALVQLKVLTTEVTPISGGRPRMAFAPGLKVAGVALFAPNGELGGAAVHDGSQLAITYVTTDPATGEYPVMTVSVRLSPDLPVGTRGLVTLEPSIWTLNGIPATSKRATATVTVGGSLAVSDVVPGEGWFPAGTVVSVRGAGFSGETRLRFNGKRIDAAQVVSSDEIQFTLSQATNMTGAEFRIDNPDARAFYYSYLRGVRAATSQRPLLAVTEPIFSGVARSAATLGPLPAMNAAFQYAALALQNPGLEPADVTLELLAADGTLLQWSLRSLDSGHRLTLDLAELFDGAAPPPGASVRVTSSGPVETFGLLVDERTRTVTPRLPNEATPSVGSPLPRRRVRPGIALP